MTTVNMRISTSRDPVAMPSEMLHMDCRRLLSTTSRAPKLLVPVRSSVPVTIGFQSFSISEMSSWSTP